MYVDTYLYRYESEHVAHTHADGYCIVAVFMAKNSRYHNRELEEIAHVLPVIKEIGSDVVVSRPLSLMTGNTWAISSSSLLWYRLFLAMKTATMQ